MIKVALYEPEIPPNTGNIGRLCVGFCLPLILIEPLGFALTDPMLKRAGLDYWKALQVRRMAHISELMADEPEGENTPRRVVCISKFGTRSLYEWSFQAGDVLLMGNETRGVPQAVTERYNITRLSIPMSENIRSYNLANATAMSIAEAYRQLRWSLVG